MSNLKIRVEDGKNIITVPSGIRYISKWSDYSLDDFQFPHILDKKMPGCGYTEFCIRNDQDLILCSPRRVLLENKEKQHNIKKKKLNPDGSDSGEYEIITEVFYARNELENAINCDKDLMAAKNITSAPEEPSKDLLQELINNMKTSLDRYIQDRMFSKKPIKILVTYDSFRLIKGFLKDNIKDFQIVVDEFQSILVDSRFKSGTEIEFLNELQGLDRVCYVSATPMLDKYLKKIPEFASLPYYELDWLEEDILRAVSPDYKVRTTKSIVSEAVRIINTYKSGEFEIDITRDSSGNLVILKSTEAVFYVNSVNNILDIIKKTGLTAEETNILCARNSENIKRIKKKLGKHWEIGEVPLKDKPHKMFTFCTRTVYLGADFYSKCARTFILSDANIESLSVDISLDLQQILGRQRLEENPWKNRAEFYYKTLKKSKILEEVDFREEIERKITNSNNLLLSFSDTSTEQAKQTLAEVYERCARTFNYKSDYVAVNRHAGRGLVPCINNLVLISEERAFDIQQIDYKDRSSVFSAVMYKKLLDPVVGADILKFKATFESLYSFNEKMKFLCEAKLDKNSLEFILDQIDHKYKNYYYGLGPERCRANGYDVTRMRRELEDLTRDFLGDLNEEIYANFKEGNRYLLSDIKDKLREVYEKSGYSRTPKAVDLENYFDVKRCKISSKVDGKRSDGLEIIKKKNK